MAHQEGNTPGRTPDTRTRSVHFRHPQADGRVHYGDESWPIAAGVVECPLEVGEGAEWPRATEAEIEAYQAAVTPPVQEPEPEPAGKKKK